MLRKLSLKQKNWFSYKQKKNKKQKMCNYFEWFNFMAVLFR